MKSNGIGRAIGKRELQRPEEKREYNRRLFAVVARRYDLVTRFLSFGQDQRWKRRLIALIPRRVDSCGSAGCVFLDLACGTGDITALLHHTFPKAHVTGLDLSEEMLAYARRRIGAMAGGAMAGGAVALLSGDMNHLRWHHNSVDMVTGGYALRNAPDLGHTLREVHRVLRPGGVALFLDFSASPRRIIRAVQFRVLRFWGQVWGMVLHGDPEVYGYIARSLRAYPHALELQELCRRSGFAVLPSPRFMGGMMCILRLRKPRG